MPLVPALRARPVSIEVQQDPEEVLEKQEKFSDRELDRHIKNLTDKKRELGKLFPTNDMKSLVRLMRVKNSRSYRKREK